MAKKISPEKDIKKSVTTSNESWYLKHAIKVFAVLIFVLYARSISMSYTFLDDSIFLLDKGESNEKLSSIISAFSEGTFSAKDIYYRPLFRISFVIERQIMFLVDQDKYYDAAPVLSHIINILLHFIAVCLLFKFLQILLKSKQMAFIWSIIFALHPALTMAVAWIPGRNDLMIAIFFFSFFIYFFKYLENSNIKFLIYQFLFLLLALLTKETAVFIPLIAGLYLIIHKRKEIFSKKILMLYPIWAINLLIWYILRSRILDSTAHQSNGQLQNTIIERLPGLLQYLGKIFLPFNLTVYPTPIDTTMIYGIISLILLVGLILLSEKLNYKNVLFGFLWFIIFLLPFFFVPRWINNALFEHRLYISMVGILLILNEVILSFKDKIEPYGRNIFGAVVLIFFGITFNYMQYFNDQISFYEKAVQDSPSDAYVNKMLGIRYLTNGKENQALPYIQKSYQIDSTQNYVNYFIAKLSLIPNNSLERAKILLDREIQKNPNFADSYFDRAYIAFQQKDIPTAIIYLKKFQVLRPDDPMANNNLLKSYIDLKQKENAVNQLNYMIKRGLAVDEATKNIVNNL